MGWLYDETIKNSTSETFTNLERPHNTIGMQPHEPKSMCVGTSKYYVDTTSKLLKSTSKIMVPQGQAGRRPANNTLLFQNILTSIFDSKIISVDFVKF